MKPPFIVEFVDEAGSPGQTMAQAVYLSGRYSPPALCSGLAACGRCRMRVLSPEHMPAPTETDRRRFTEDELRLGWRLGCRHRPRPGMRVALPPEIRASGFAAFQEYDRPAVMETALPPASCLSPSDASQCRVQGRPIPHGPVSKPLMTHRLRQPKPYMALGLAVDIGTTTLEWELFSLEPEPGGAPPPPLWRGACINPQMGAGSDVLTRLAVAGTPGGRESLHRLTLAALRSLQADSLTPGRSGFPAPELGGLCLAGNPAMTAITLDLDTAGLSASPYALPTKGGCWAELPGLAPAWIPPQLSPFSGGDVAAGYAFLACNPARETPPYPFLLADMGTNGEFLLALKPDLAFTASVALGPALEGTGLSHGTEARAGAVAGFQARPDGPAAFVLEECPGQGGWRAVPAAGNEASPGITGTGYLSLLHTLLRHGGMDEDGRFIPARGGIFRNALSEGGRGTGQRLRLPLGLALYAADVEELLKVKAAFSLGLRRLLARAGIAARDLAAVCLAGSLGLHTDKDALEELGFFPPGMAKRLCSVGNASLAGASLLLRSRDARDALRCWAARVRPVDLASDPEFVRDYTSHMRFRW